MGGRVKLRGGGKGGHFHSKKRSQGTEGDEKSSLFFLFLYIVWN